MQSFLILQQVVYKDTVTTPANVNLSLSTPCSYKREDRYSSALLNTLWIGDADLRLYITTVQDG